MANALARRVESIEAELNSNSDVPFEFGCEYRIVRDADPDIDQAGNERSEYSFHPPLLRPGEYIASQTPLMMTHRQLDELLAAINNRSRTITPYQSQGVQQ